jgi:hypothetical protein
MRAEADGIHIGPEEAAEANDPKVGTGTPETAPFEEVEQHGEVEVPVALDDDATISAADGRAADGDDEAVDAPEAGGPDGSE